MACGIQRPDPQLLFDRYKSMFSANVLGGSPVIPESNEWYVVALDYAAAQEFYSISEQEWRERDPRYACCDNLIDLASVDGVFPKAASFAEGYAKLTGTVLAVIPVGTEMAFNGQNFRTVGTSGSQISSDGTQTVRVRAVAPGPGANLATGADIAGALSSGLAGVNSAVVLCGGNACGGSDVEDCETFRTRYLARKAYQPRATDAWVKQKLLEWPCATRVCKREGSCCTDITADGCDTCAGLFNYYVLFDGTFPCGIAPKEITDQITEWMFGLPTGYGLGQVEVGICGLIYAITGVTVNITINGLACITPAQQQEIIAGISELFSTICPSNDFYARQIETLIAQIVGSASAFDVIMVSSGTGVVVNRCGDLEVACDYLPCLGAVTIAGAGSSVSGCA